MATGFPPKFSQGVAQAMLAPIRPLLDGREAVVFFICQYGIKRIGHLFDDPAILRTLYPASEYQVFAVHERITPEAEASPGYRIAMQGMHPVQLPEEPWKKLLEYLHASERPDERVRVEGVTFHFYRHPQLKNLYCAALAAGRTVPPVDLGPAYSQAAPKILDRLGVPADRPLVVLHVRAGGFAKGELYREYRNASIRNYLPAIAWLRDQGYAVLRVGDRTMARLPRMGPAVIDAATAPPLASRKVPDYLLEASAIAHCDFMVGMASGPASIAASMGKPVLLTNLPVLWASATPGPRDLLLFREYREITSGRRLSFAETSRNPIFDLLDRIYAKDLGVDILENSPALLAAATREMVERLKQHRAGASAAAPCDARFRTIVARIQERRRNRAAGKIPGGLGGLMGLRALEQVNIGYNTPGVQLSQAGCDANPAFLK